MNQLEGVARPAAVAEQNTMYSSDLKEAVNSILEKRAPEYRGQ